VFNFPLVQADALAKLLIEKRLTTEAEYMKKLSAERAVWGVYAIKLA